MLDMLDMLDSFSSAKACFVPTRNPLVITLELVINTDQ